MKKIVFIMLLAIVTVSVVSSCTEEEVFLPVSGLEELAMMGASKSSAY